VQATVLYYHGFRDSLGSKVDSSLQNSTQIWMRWLCSMTAYKPLYLNDYLSPCYRICVRLFQLPRDAVKSTVIVRMLTVTT